MALTTHPPVQKIILLPLAKSNPDPRAAPARKTTLRRTNKNRKPGAHKDFCPHAHTHLELLPYGVPLGKTLYAAAPRKTPAFRKRSWSWRRDLNP
ncbi:hypothetical protein SBA7_450003 [Candidatus Sulfotelmatobacter sp. SbA7]|nr:hypothetical protein SBA7_450003 [Candidatus Sulfotelmatobacter sp. SbA7]